MKSYTRKNWQPSLVDSRHPPGASLRTVRAVSCPQPPVTACWWSATQSCPTLCSPRDHSRPGFPALQHLQEFAQTPVIGVTYMIHRRQEAGIQVRPWRPASCLALQRPAVASCFHTIPGKGKTPPQRPPAVCDLSLFRNKTLQRKPSGSLHPGGAEGRQWLGSL